MNKIVAKVIINKVKNSVLEEILPIKGRYNQYKDVKRGIENINDMMRYYGNNYRYAIYKKKLLGPRIYMINNKGSIEVGRVVCKN